MVHLSHPPCHHLTRNYPYHLDHMENQTPKERLPPIMKIYPHHLYRMERQVSSGSFGGSISLQLPSLQIATSFNTNHSTSFPCGAPKQSVPLASYGTTSKATYQTQGDFSASFGWSKPSKVANSSGPPRLSFTLFKILEISCFWDCLEFTIKL